jgi:hypothetical protein
MEVSRTFGETNCLHLEGRRMRSLGAGSSVVDVRFHRVSVLLTRHTQTDPALTAPSSSRNTVCVLIQADVLYVITEDGGTLFFRSVLILL